MSTNLDNEAAMMLMIQHMCTSVHNKQLWISIPFAEGVTPLESQVIFIKVDKG